MNPYYKTKLCLHYQQGDCKYGDSCQFIHRHRETLPLQRENLGCGPHRISSKKISNYSLSKQDKIYNPFEQTSSDGWRTVPTKKKGGSSDNLTETSLPSNPYEVLEEVSLVKHTETPIQPSVLSTQEVDNLDPLDDKYYPTHVLTKKDVDLFLDNIERNSAAGNYAREKMANIAYQRFEGQELNGPGVHMTTLLAVTDLSIGKDGYTGAPIQPLPMAHVLIRGADYKKLWSHLPSAIVNDIPDADSNQQCCIM